MVLALVYSFVVIVAVVDINSVVVFVHSEGWWWWEGGGVGEGGWFGVVVVVVVARVSDVPACVCSFRLV